MGRVMPRCYVAGCYTNPDRAVRAYHVRAARDVARLLVAAGCYPVVPHLVGFETEDLQTEQAWWLKATSEELATCDAMVLVPEHESSAGTAAEIVQCNTENRPIFTLQFTVLRPEGRRDWRLSSLFKEWRKQWR